MLKSIASLLLILMSSQFSFASDRCFSEATRMAYNYVVPGTALVDVSPAPIKDRRFKKYVATFVGQQNPTSRGYVVMILTARDCKEYAAIPSF